ncbi:hypothetical protein [Pseudonocardia sp. GCM10023141]|uniref:hypothetical protein n=1 Tax=Pseudonocardia sp. GCM10023141 TaxID=3252653 RepID=UPI003613C8C6
MTESDRRVSVVTLAGPQHTAVEANRPGAASAVVSVRIGAATLYTYDPHTTRALLHTWQLAARKARTLPIRSDSETMMRVAGRSEPAVRLHAVECPTVWSRFDVNRRQLQICIGRLVFEVKDHDALRTTLLAFRNAEQIAQVTFAASNQEAPQSEPNSPNRGCTHRGTGAVAAAGRVPAAARMTSDGRQR